MSDSEKFTKAISTAQLAPGAGACVEIAGRRIAIFNANGEYYAIDDECPHVGGPLSDGYITDCTITCPLHAWDFDLKTGQLDGDPDTCVQTYPVRIEGEDVLIALPCDESTAESPEPSRQD